MDPFNIVTAVAVPFEESNVDTDQICPARLIRTLVGRGSDRVLFHDRRFNEDGSAKPEFIFNKPAYSGAQIVVANRNFGIGSSREAAVFAVLSAGYRAIIAESFGDIFANNCARNGILTVRLPADALAALRQDLLARPGVSITIDLPSQTITSPDGTSHGFVIGALRKRCLMEGLDDLALTERYGPDILAFERSYHAELPWLEPRPE